MESEPTPEINRPAQFECDSCGERVITTYENTLYFCYEKQWWFNHTRTVCEEDGFSGIMFIDNTDIDKLEFANQFVRYPSEDGFCDDESIIEFYRQVYGIEDIEERELTEVDERWVGFAHWLIENKLEETLGEWDEMDGPTP